MSDNQSQLVADSGSVNLASGGGDTLNTEIPTTSMQQHNGGGAAASYTPLPPYNMRMRKPMDTTSAPVPSSTAYSFSGSALGSEKITATTTGPTSTETKSENTQQNNNNNDKEEDSLYECNICLDTAKDAVVSMCGHLFCWPCLHQWLETRPNRMLCPVCKAAISKEKVIPLYGRNSSKQEDPRNKVPPRPAGQRTEPEPPQGFQGFGFGDGFHMSFGIGAFPFAYFASSFNIEPRPAPNRGTTQYEDEQILSKVFLYLACLCIAWLMFA